MKTTLSGGSDQLIPKGYPFVENLVLPASDVEQMVDNLLGEQFVGCVQVKLGPSMGYLMIADGSILRCLESNSRGNLFPRLQERIFRLMRSRPSTEVSTYVLSETMTSLLGNSFAFNQYMPDSRIERKRLQSILTDLDIKQISGIVRLVGPEGLTHLLVEDGNILTERFAEGYGEIVCGATKVSSLLDHIHENGSRIMIRGDVGDNVRRKVQEAEDDLGRIRQLSLKKASALFRSAEEVKVSEEIFREWGLDPKAQIEVELETTDGRMHTYKCRTGSSRLGSQVEVLSKMLTDMNAEDKDYVNVRPII